MLEMTIQSYYHDQSTKRSLTVDLTQSSSIRKAIENSHEKPNTYNY